MKQPNAPLDTLIARLHGQGRMRVWSLIVTMLGDIAGEQDAVPLATILDLTGRMRIDERAVRTALSRLSHDGLAMSQRDDGVTAYRFAPEGLKLFSTAQARIYEAPIRLQQASWRFHILPPLKADERGAALNELNSQGAATASTGFALWPSHRAVTAPMGLTLPFAPSEIPDWVTTAFCAKQAHSTYAQITSIAERVVISDDALALRVLLLHAWRRAILRHPPLPSVMTPEDWAFEPAHKAMANAYQLLASAGDLPAGTRRFKDS